MKKLIAVLVSTIILLSCLCACGSKVQYDDNVETLEFTDSCGRTVEIPSEITRVAPSGSVAQMILATIAPDLMVGLASTPGNTQVKYYPDYFSTLPTFGQFYGSKATLNLESLISADPQIIIDLGDKKSGHEADMNAVQEQTGVATVFIESDLPNLAQAYRTLGKLLNREERGEEMAAFIDKTLEMAAENSKKISADEVVSVMYATGTDGLNANASGSIQSKVIELVVAENAVVVKDVSNAGIGNTLSLEQIYNFDPDVIVVTAGGGYDTILGDSAWSELNAVKNGKVYEIPGLPYNWMSNPPSVNMTLGVWWLGNLLYPDVYDYDMVRVAQEFYRTFYGYELSEDEAQDYLANSTMKVAGK